MHLFNGHTLIYGAGGHCAAELVRVDFIKVQAAPQAAQANLHAADFQACVRGIQRDKQRRVIVLAAMQIILQMQLCLGIKIHTALFITLAEHYALAGFKVYIGNVQVDKLPHAHTGRIQQINHSQIPRTGAMVAQLFYCFV